MREAAVHLREVPFLGIHYVVGEATKLGYRPGDPDWINLGQGQPEIGALPGAPDRIERVDPGAGPRPRPDRSAPRRTSPTWMPTTY